MFLDIKQGIKTLIYVPRQIRILFFLNIIRISKKKGGRLTKIKSGRNQTEIQQPDMEIKQNKTRYGKQTLLNWRKTETNNWFTKVIM